MTLFPIPRRSTFRAARAAVAAAACATLLWPGAGQAQPVQAPQAPDALNYVGQGNDQSAIPMAERGLPTVRATPYFKLSDKPFPAEGLVFDRAGNLYICDIYNGAILKLTPDGKLSTFYKDAAKKFAGLAVHKDGRIFAADVGTGAIIAISADGASATTILPSSPERAPDDIVFDDAGGFYFTDFRGNGTTPINGVYHVSPDYKTVTSVLPLGSMSNGVALSPDNKVLWSTDFTAETLHRSDLNAEGKVTRSHITYRFVGRGPDSMRVDADGNVYVAITNQGRVLVFNTNGIPIGQILVPGRETNNFLRLTSLAFIPGTRDIVFVSWDPNGTGGTMLFRTRGFAKGATPYSHR